MNEPTPPRGGLLGGLRVAPKPAAQPRAEPMPNIPGVESVSGAGPAVKPAAPVPAAGAPAPAATPPNASPQAPAPVASALPTSAPASAPKPAATPRSADNPNIYRPNILIIGDSGTGKTSSLRNLPWDKVRFVDAEQKGLPFDGVPIDYVAPRGSIAIEKAMFTSDKPIVVLDSLTKYIEQLDAEMNEAHQGYEIWGNYNQRLSAFLNRCKSAKQTFILTAIPELLTVVSPDGMGNSNERRVATRGKGWEGKIEKEFAYVFFTLYKTDMKATPVPKTSYYFQTNAAGTNRAKSPIGVFADLYIDNDINAALVKMQEHRRKAIERSAAPAA